MKLRTVIYALLLATLCMGCGGRLSMRELERLEARMNDAPDSVLAVLTATDMPRWGEARALYALLTVQAQDKSYIDVADDSLISVATRYYDRNGLPLRRLQAFYYHGRVYANAGHRHEAMAAYSHAKDFVPEVDAPYPVGLLYYQLGVCYGNNFDYPLGLFYMEKALECYELAGKERLQYIVKAAIGQSYLNLNRFEEAETILNEVLEWGKKSNDTYVISRALNLLLRLHDATGDIEALDSLFGSYPLDIFRQNQATYHAAVAHYHALKGDITVAEEALSRAWDASRKSNDTIFLHHKSYLIYKTSGRTDKALSHHEWLLAFQDSIARVNLQQPLMAIQLDHYQDRLETEELRNLNYRYLMAVAALIIFIVAIALWALYRERFRRKDELIRQYMDAANQLSRTLYSKDEELCRVTDALQRQTADTDSMQQRIASLFREQYRVLDELCVAYYENTFDKKKQENIFGKVSDTIRTFASEEGYAKLESVVNDCRSEVMTLLRREFPAFKESDFRLLCYFCAELSVQSISLLTDNTPEKLWVYKGRLIKRIKSSDAPSKDIILAQIPQRKR